MSRWLPPVSEKQLKFIADQHVYRLLSGPRRAGKTIGGLHDLSYHAWNTNNAHIAMVGRTVTDNFDGGAWNDLHKYVLPAWFAGGFGMKYTKTPRMDGGTHKIICDVTNRFGGTSRIQLDSLKYEDEVEQRFKGKRYSYLYITEGSNFKKRKSFDVWMECLRMLHLKAEQHRLVVDTNPADDGEDSWIYELWYKFRLKQDWSDTDSNLIPFLKHLQAQLSVHEFTIDDNQWMSEEEKGLQRAKYAHDQDLYDRYFLGLWKKAHGTGVFSDVFRPNLHIIGDLAQNEILLPEPECAELGEGWDIGKTNNAALIIEPVSIYNTDKKIEEFSFKVLDEFIELNRPVSIAEITEVMLEKRAFWQNKCTNKIFWQAVSDQSAFDKYDNISDTYEYKEVFTASDGEIELIRGPVKSRGSVQARINLLRKLLHNERIYISANCPMLIEAIKLLKKGTTLALDPKSKYKHAFDALTYYICLKCFAEMERDLLNLTKKQPQSGSSTSSIIRLNL